MKTFVLSCEHASNVLPNQYKSLYSDNFLKTHRAYDAGALTAFKYLQKELDLWGMHGQFSRLLIDLNRSLPSPTVFSERSSKLTQEDKEYITKKIYLPYRQAVKDKIGDEINRGNQVVHLSIHSFTPVLKGQQRRCHLGLLFDEERNSEQSLCEALAKNMSGIPNLVVAFNEPYSGSEDGFTTYLRDCFHDEHYSGIEIEFNQKILQQRRFKHVLSVLTHFIQATHCI